MGHTSEHDTEARQELMSDILAIIGNLREGNLFDDRRLNHVLPDRVTIVLRRTMGRYYVNKDALENGDHEVHAWGCALTPVTENCRDLGEFSNCADAVTEAQKINPQSKGCIWCSLN